MKKKKNRCGAFFDARRDEKLDSIFEQLYLKRKFYQFYYTFTIFLSDFSLILNSYCVKKKQEKYDHNYSCL